MELFRKIWRVARWILLALVVTLIAVFVLYFIPAGAEKIKTEQMVAKIHATRLTWDDVFGSLPPAPDPTKNNATLAGMDANNNGIRDDVEIAIYNAHKNSAKVAAAEFQYAKELQMEFTDVFNSATLVAVIQEETRGFLCIPGDTDVKEVENLVFNNQTRQDWREKIRDEYMIGYKTLQTPACDIDPETLPN